MKIKYLCLGAFAAASLFTFNAAMASSEAAHHHARGAEHSHHAKKTAETAKVDINTATAMQLAGLKRIGTKKAAAIVQYREQNGPFKSVEDLTKVKGVSESIVEANRGQMSLS